MQTREISEQSQSLAQMFLLIFAAVFLFPCILKAASGPPNAPALAKAPGDARFVPRYDLVIRNGRIVDGTGNPWFYGDVAIKGDRIMSVGTAADQAMREIDARGLVIAPGFIDMHSHSDWVLLEDGNAQSKIRQGVTTEVLGEGGSVGPW